MDATVVWTAIGALGAIAAAAVAAWAAYQSRSSSEKAGTAAEKASAAASTLAAIERSRRHDELTPEFEITCTVQDASADSALLYVMLKPGTLERLDEVTITIQDETRSDHWVRGLPDGVSQEEAAVFVWGPFEFNTGASEQVESNRTTRPRAYSVVTGKNWDLLGLTHTRPGRWMTGAGQDWRKQQAGKPVRVLLTCRLGGFAPWLIQRDVAVWYAGRPAGAADRSAVAAERQALASERSAAVAEDAAVRERQRRHAEMTPRFQVSFDRPSGQLRVFLAGPHELGRLDLLTVRVRDDDSPPRAGLRIAGAPTWEDAQQPQIWGPYRFIPGRGPGAGVGIADRGADRTGRVTPTGGMPVGEELVFFMEPTPPPSWAGVSSEEWQRQYGPVIRLQLECVREGWEPWSLPCAVDSAAGETVEVP